MPNSFDDTVNYRSVSSFYQDNQDNIWIGTHLLGVNVVNPNGENLRLYNNLAKDNSKSSTKSTWGISEDANNNIWVGTDGGGLYKFNPFTNNVEKFLHNPLDNNSISDNAILSSCYDSNGNLWIGTYAGGLNVLKPGSTKFTHYKKGLSNKSLNSNDIRVIFEDSKQRIWHGSPSGFNLYDPLIQQFSLYDLNENSEVQLKILPRGIIKDFYPGYLTIGGQFSDGLHHINPTSGDIINSPVSKDFLKERSFSSWGLTKISDDELLATAYTELYYFKKGMKELIPFKNLIRR